MRYQPVGQVVSIVVTGSLNPVIFSPAWLHLNSVINAAEFEAAKIVVIHPEVTDFTVDTLRLQVTAQRFTIISSELPFIRIADLASTIFGSLLPHTPVHQIGFNLQLHFNLESPRQRWTLGRKLAPIEPWGSWGG